MKLRWPMTALLAALTLGCGHGPAETEGNGDLGILPSEIPDGGERLPADAGSGPTNTDARPAEPTFPGLAALPSAEGGCSRLGREVRISAGTARAERPQVIWDDREYVLVWSDGRFGTSDLYVARMNYLGERLGLEEVVARTPENSRWPALTLRDVGDPLVAWEETRGDETRVLVRRLGKDVPPGDPVEIAVSGLPQARPSLASTGRNSFITWMERQGGVKLGRLDQNGGLDPAFTPVQVGDGRATLPQVAAQRDQIAVAYVEPPAPGAPMPTTRIRLAVFNPQLEPVRDLLLRDHPTRAGDLSLVWSGSVWTVSWEDLRTGAEEIYTAQISPQGALVGPGRLHGDEIASANWPRMASSGRFTPVAYYAFVSGAEIMVSLVDSEGRKLGSDLRLSNSPGAARFPDIAHNSRNNQFGIAWEDTHTTGVPEIRFARISCSNTPVEPATP